MGNQWRDYASATSKSFQVGEAKSAPEVIREITDEIETMNEKITELLRESVEKIKMILKRPPHEWIGAFRHFRQLGLVASDTSSLFKFSLGIAFAALSGFFILKFLRSTQTV